MKRFSILPCLALTALSLLAAGTPARAGERPIRAEGRGYVPFFNDPFAFLNGLGRSEHLGPCTLSIYLDFYELYEGNIVPRALLLEAANGDRLGARVTSEFDSETGIVVGTVTFMGGTGRFADATGSARLLIVPDSYWFTYDEDGYLSDFSQTGSSWVLDGTIDY
jgi:hypothetical protein